MATEIQLSRNHTAVVDDCDAELVRPYTWRYVKNKNCEYAHAWHPQTGELVTMHRLVANAPDGLDVDHRDGNGLNNSRGNLRVATRSQNLHNSRKHCKSASRFKGVWKHESGRWVAQLRVNGRKIVKCGFKTEEDAALHYDQMAIEHCGEFARTNFAEAGA